MKQEKADETICIRVTKSQKKKYEEAAKGQKQSLSKFAVSGLEMASMPVSKTRLSNLFLNLQTDINRIVQSAGIVKTYDVAILHWRIKEICRLLNS